MSRIIAGIYEIEEKIGAGGGGIVYLGRHIRLDKKIVLKADKRKLSAGVDRLRREVDLLKGLSHTYIPQVYDFVQEGDTVYTVMDYVEGESLDKVLARGEKIPQREIVKWACQLLEALSYLHNQKPNGILHGDIKPANIMLRPEGDICLIDFNIALALGEDGAVQVGYSRGYASPEHYGSDGYALDTRTGSKSVRVTAGSSTATMQKKKFLDVRSDIYSLGATLYHMLSGKRPAEKAAEVVPLDGVCSPQIAAIIQKSMDPDSTRRYQSAEEMLDAFLHLRTNDARVKKNKRRFAISAAVSFLLLLSGGICILIGQKQAENYQASLTAAGYSQKLLADGNQTAAVEQAMQALDTGEGILQAPVPAAARLALTDALGVYDLSDGFKPDDVVSLPAEPFDLEVSPEGTRYAVVYAYEAAVYSVGEKEPEATRALQRSALSDCLFLDEDTIVYAGEQGVEAFDLAAGKVLWTGEKATYLTLSGDRKVAAAVNRNGDGVALYRTEDGKKIGECPFGERRIQELANDIYADYKNYIFELDNTGKWLAVSFSNGALSIFDTADSENELILYDESEYGVFSGGFCGAMFAYAAQGTGRNFFGIVDTNELSMIASLDSQDSLIARADENGIFLSEGSLLAWFDADTLEETELAYVEGQSIRAYDARGRFSMIATDGGDVSFYDSGANLVSRFSYEETSDFVKLADGYALTVSRDKPSVRLLRLEDHGDARICSYDADYAHDEARIDTEGQTAMLFHYKGFRTYSLDGDMTAECEMPDAENIYDQQYVRDGESPYLEVTWYDGTVRRYGTDGLLLSEERLEPPDQDLDEEFETDGYRIVSKLNAAPEVYDLKSGKYAGKLEEDANLTYVTQLDGCIMTEYVDTKLNRYGILLDEDLEKIANLPCLCDVYDNTAVFDFHNGELRACKLYSLDELVTLGSEYLQNHTLQSNDT